MIKNTNIAELPEPLQKAAIKMNAIVNSYLTGISFIHMNTARDPKYKDCHLLSYLVQDLIQSAVSMLTLSAEGMLNVARREVRFILEASIKLCYVQQKDYQLTVDERIEKFDKQLTSQKISINKSIDLNLFSEEDRPSFIEECGRIYGLTSSYVHLTPLQLNERISAINAGQVSGRESAEDFEELNCLVARGLAASLVLLFHSVPEHVAGDLLVGDDGSSLDWYFSQSHFIAAIDGKFDYKHERQQKLQKIQEYRKSNISF